MRNHEFPTAAINIRPANIPGRPGKVTLTENAGVLGCLVEVLETNSVIATQSQPAGIEPLVRRLRGPK